MLEFSKKILVSVSFDRQLFYKELKKAIKRITDLGELQDFKDWCTKEFGQQYPSTIQLAFA